MKKIEAIVRYSRFEDVKEALEKNGINFFTFMEVKGHGQQKGEKVTYRGAFYDSGDIPRILIEIIVPDEEVQKVIDAIISEARTGNIGDGKIIVTPVEHFITIRTGANGHKAM